MTILTLAGFIWMLPSMAILSQKRVKFSTLQVGSRETKCGPLRIMGGNKLKIIYTDTVLY